VEVLTCTPKKSSFVDAHHFVSFSLITKNIYSVDLTGIDHYPISRDIASQYGEVRSATLAIIEPLEAEDCVVQPAEHVSPPKWHLAHTTWFFETFILQPHFSGYRVFNPQFGFIFNSYYESLGERAIRTERGSLSRPTVTEVVAYRKYVDEAMADFLKTSAGQSTNILQILELGLQHEMQHQELLYADIKYILGHNPLLPVYHKNCLIDLPNNPPAPSWIDIPKGNYSIGFDGDGFAFDNELQLHEVHLPAYAISGSLVSHEAYFNFIEAGGYKHFQHWHSDGWDWVQATGAKAPRYLHWLDGKWHHYTLSGLKVCDPKSPVLHINFYEASAFASWMGLRLPTEQEWETASAHLKWGDAWEWTGSAYLPYPGYVQPKGVIGEYNGKFMVNQIVLRGASKATYPGHSRPTYRNFFQPLYQWQFTGIRLAKSL
jgi:ergothioneine biosynthesis protein EgtB